MADGAGWMVAAACHVASGMLVERRIPYRGGGHALPTRRACPAVHSGCTAAGAPGRERSDEACKTTKVGGLVGGRLAVKQNLGKRQANEDNFTGKDNMNPSMNLARRTSILRTVCRSCWTRPRGSSGRSSWCAASWKLFGTSSAYSASRRAQSMLQILNWHGTVHARPNPRRIQCPSRRASPNGPIIGLHAEIAAGGREEPRLARPVRSHASLSKVRIFPRCRWLANPFSIRFGVSAVGAAARAAGGMPEYGEYPSRLLF